MAKTLYSIDAINHNLMAFSGVSWTTVCALDLDGLTWASQTEGQSWVLFSCEGNLYCAFIGTNSQWNVCVNIFDGTSTMTATNALAISNPVSSWKWSNPVNYRGFIYWVEKGVGSGSYTQWSVYRFDPTNGLIKYTAVVGIPGTTDSATATDQQSYVPILYQHRDRILMTFPTIVANNPQSGVLTHNLIYELDFNSGGAGTNITFVPSLAPDFFADISVQATPASTADVTQLKNTAEQTYISAGSYNGKMIVLSTTGVLYHLTEDGGNRIQIADIRDFANFQVGNITFTPGSNNQIAGSGTAIQKYNYGNKLTGIGGTNGLSGHVITTLGNSNSTLDIGCYDETTSALMVTPGSSQEFLTSWSFISYINTVGMYCSTFCTTVNNVFYMFVGFRNTGATTPPCIVITYDGTTVNVLLLVVGGVSPSITQLSGYLDETSGIVHLAWYDTTANNIHHAGYNTNTLSSTDYGVISSQATTNYLPGVQTGHIGAWDTNDGDVLVLSTTQNSLGTLVTITYKLYSNDSHTVNLSVKYDNGSGLTTATAGGGDGITGLTTSPSGVSHTFVHNIATDQPSFSGPIDYKVQIVP